jgi:hypothetical protein
MNRNKRHALSTKNILAVSTLIIIAEFPTEIVSVEQLRRSVAQSDKPFKSTLTMSVTVDPITVSCFTSKLHVLISETLAARGSIWKFE